MRLGPREGAGAQARSLLEPAWLHTAFCSGVPGRTGVRHILGIEPRAP